MKLWANAFYFKVLLLLLVTVLAVSVSALPTMTKDGHIGHIDNTDILELMPYKTQETPSGHFLAKRSPFKPLTLKGILLAKKGLLLPFIG